MSVETFYTPERVELFLRRLPFLLDAHTPPDDAVRSRPSKTSPSGRLEELMATRADIEMALSRLPQPTYRIVYLRFVGGKSLREVAAIVKVSHVTVSHHAREGVRRMAWELGWRDPESGWGERRR